MQRVCRSNELNHELPQRLNVNIFHLSRMKNRQLLILLCVVWGFVLNTGCSSQGQEKAQLYPACEPRSNTDPGRLHIRAGAEEYGMVSPCAGRLEFYINTNSQVRSLALDLEYMDMDDERVHQEQIRADLESRTTGMFQKEIAAKTVQGEQCRSLQMVIQSISCFTEDGRKIDCPDVRVIPPNTFHLLKVDDRNVNVCSAEL